MLPPQRVLLFLLTALLAQAAVDRIYVNERTDVENGRDFGASGPYEKITAKVHFRVDPKLEQNRAIVDIGLAPVDENGMVRFSADLQVLKPRDPARGNGTAIIDIPNRGGMVTGNFNRDDAFLMDRGFTVVAVGWQWDVAEGKIGLQAPRLPDSITGVVRSEFVATKTVPGFSLADRDHTAYPVADVSDQQNKLYVSDAPGASRTEVPAGQWRFSGSYAVEVNGGCIPGKIYEVVYRARGAVPTGLGFAAVRDMASFMKFGESPFLLGDQRRFIKRTLGFGVSQTGRFLRHMVYQGFNEDEKGRMALDGVWADVAGAGRGGFNHRFAQPSRDGQAHLHYSWPVDMFPFTDSETADSLTSNKDGLLTRALTRKVSPKIFYTNHSYEYWGRAASLIHTTPDGSRDVPPSRDTRIYFIAGGQHGSGSLPFNRQNVQNLSNPLELKWVMRGLLVAFHEWLKDGVEPPASVFPHIAGGELVRPDKVSYPAGIQAPKWPRVPQVLDFGPEFVSKGVVTVEPPKTGEAYRMLVPQVDADGNELGGVRLPVLAVPLGAFTGWNFRATDTGAPDRMIAFIGSFFPLAPAEQQKRYGDRQTYQQRVRQAASELAGRRLTLASDTGKIVESAGQLWDAVHGL